MTDTAKVPRKRDGGGPGRRPLIDEELADQSSTRPGRGPGTAAMAGSANGSRVSATVSLILAPLL
jgi:hypothetical protein